MISLFKFQFCSLYLDNDFRRQPENQNGLLLLPLHCSFKRLRCFILSLLFNSCLLKTSFRLNRLANISLVFGRLWALNFVPSIERECFYVVLDNRNEQCFFLLLSDRSLFCKLISCLSSIWFRWISLFILKLNFSYGNRMIFFFAWFLMRFCHFCFC